MMSLGELLPEFRLQGLEIYDHTLWWNFYEDELMSCLMKTFMMSLGELLEECCLQGI